MESGHHGKIGSHAQNTVVQGQEIEREHVNLQRMVVNGVYWMLITRMNIVTHNHAQVFHNYFYTFYKIATGKHIYKYSTYSTYLFILLIL